jgi:hypothetical protein
MTQNIYHTTKQKSQNAKYKTQNPQPKPEPKTLEKQNRSGATVKGLSDGHHGHCVLWV